VLLFKYCLLFVYLFCVPGQLLLLTGNNIGECLPLIHKLH